MQADPHSGSSLGSEAGNLKPVSSGHVHLSTGNRLTLTQLSGADQSYPRVAVTFCAAHPWGAALSVICLQLFC